MSSWFAQSDCQAFGDMCGIQSCASWSAAPRILETKNQHQMKSNIRSKGTKPEDWENNPYRQSPSSCRYVRSWVLGRDGKKEWQIRRYSGPMTPEAVVGTDVRMRSKMCS